MPREAEKKLAQQEFRLITLRGTEEARCRKNLFVLLLAEGALSELLELLCCQMTLLRHRGYEAGVNIPSPRPMTHLCSN